MLEVKMKTKQTSNLFLAFLIPGLLMGSLLLSACGPVVEAQAQPFPTTPATEFTPDAVVTESDPELILQAFTNPDYRLFFTYPPDWSLTETTAGDGSPASVVVELVRDTYLIKIHIKFYWDETVIGGGMGPGETSQDGSILLLGQATNRNRLVSDDKTKLVWYGGSINDLELYILIEDASQSKYEAVEIPEKLIAEVESILASFTRTGEPVTPPPASQPTVAPTDRPAPVTCSLTPRLSVDGWAMVTPGLPNAIRSAPGRGADSAVIGEIPAGTTVRVLEGPVCASGYNWWLVDAGHASGWTAEGIQGIYWLEPSTGTGSITVDGWVGTIVSTPQWPQIDDCFQVQGQEDSRYGIISLDLDLRQQLEAYRDTGNLLRIWGTLYFNRMDAYNTQIEVTRIEVYNPSSSDGMQPVEDWWGVVVSNPVDSQFDDYFQMMDQNGTRYGIDSLDESIRQQLIDLRDTGQIIRVWGTLVRDSIDAYGGQIQVTWFEYAP